MICNRCLTRLSRRAVIAIPPNSSKPAPQQKLTRSFTQSASSNAQAVSAQTATATNPRPHDAVSAATSTSAAQPFSTPNSPAPKNISDLPINPDQTKQPAIRTPSSIPAGTVLKGLNFLKNASDPIAKPDEEYPPWLWTVLDTSASSNNSGKQSAGNVAIEGDLYSKSKNLRRKAAKALRKAALQNPDSLIPKVPLQKQTVDLFGGDGSLGGAKRAGDARVGLTKAMRGERRKGIKEDNFLREMR